MKMNIATYAAVDDEEETQLHALWKFCFGDKTPL